MVVFGLFVLTQVDKQIKVTPSIGDNTSRLPRDLWPYEGPKARNLFGIRDYPYLVPQTEATLFLKVKMGTRRGKLAYQHGQPKTTTPVTRN